MKLAEALTQVKDIKGKIAKLEGQLQSKTTVTMLAKDVVVPDHDAIFEEVSKLSTALARLKTRIVETNVKYDLMHKIHEFQEAKFAVSFLQTFADVEQKSYTLQGGAFGQNQEKYEQVATFNVAKVKETLEAKQKALRALDLQLQRENWQVDLVD